MADLYSTIEEGYGGFTDVVGGDVREPVYSTGEDRVDLPCIAYTAMLERWDLPRDLLGGTKTMRARGQRWLPKLPAEEDEQYEFRRSRSVLFNAFKRTVRQLSNRPFAEPVKVRGFEDLDAVYQEMVYDVDRCGSDLTCFAKRVFEDMIVYGLSHVLVDYPKTSAGVPGAPPVTMAQEAAEGIRPYFVHIPAFNLFYWRREKDQANGQDVLVEVRWSEECVEVKPGTKYAEETVRYVNVYTTDSWERWRLTKDKDEQGRNMYVLVAQGPNTLGKVPVVTFYTDEVHGGIAEVPLQELCDKNLEHFQSASDQRNILTFVRCGVLMFTGLSDAEMQNKVIVGPNRVWKSKNVNANARYVEHTGSGIQAGERDLDNIKQEMEILGMAPMLVRTNPATATAVGANESKSTSSLQSWARNSETSLEKCFELASEWRNVALPDSFAIDFVTDFDTTFGGANDAQVILGLRSAGDITRVTELTELQRLGKLSDDVDPVAEDAAVGEEQMASLASYQAAQLGAQDQGAGGQASQPGQTGQSVAAPQPGRAA